MPNSLLPHFDHILPSSPKKVVLHHTSRIFLAKPRTPVAAETTTCEADWAEGTRGR